MKSKKGNPFDVPVDGISERYMSMGELLRAFRSCKNSDPEMARSMAEYACQCGNIQAKLEYSKFLRTAPAPTMPPAESYKKAEQLLLELLNMLDTPSQYTAEAALELGTLYADCLRRPVGALSMFLYAKRLGAKVEDRKLKELRRKMERTDVSHLGSNSVDALNLGRELHLCGEAAKLTEFFLREAADKALEEISEGRNGSKNLYGQACLALGDFYDARGSDCAAHERTTYLIERDRMYAAAKVNGHPDYLSRS